MELWKMSQNQKWNPQQKEKAPSLHKERRGFADGDELLHQQINSRIAALNVQRQNRGLGIKDFAQVGNIFHRLLVSANDDIAFFRPICAAGVPAFTLLTTTPLSWPLLLISAPSIPLKIVLEST